VVWISKNGVALFLARAGWRRVAEGLGINVEHLVPQEPVLASD
jgi:hypothetical protein